MRKLFLLFTITIPIPFMSLRCVKDAEARPPAVIEIPSASSHRHTEPQTVTPFVTHTMPPNPPAIMTIPGDTSHPCHCKPRVTNEATEVIIPGLLIGAAGWVFGRHFAKK